MDEILTLIEKTAFMKSVELFAKVPTEALAFLAARGREIHLDPGQVLYREGDPNQGAFLIVEGAVEIRRGRVLDSVRGAGLGFGELELGAGEPHTSTVIAREHTHLLGISNEVLYDAVLDYPEVGLALVRTLAERINELSRRIQDLEDLVAELQSGAQTPEVQP